jgi:hypothetical protein
MICKHLWIRDGFGEKSRRRYYCQKCLCEIDVERWKNVTNVFLVSNPIENPTKHNSQTTDKDNCKVCGAR